MKKQKILLVHPGASFSVNDVHEGLRAGLEAREQELVHFDLDSRIGFASSWLRNRWKALGSPKQRPSVADVYYLASQEIIERALRHQVDWVILVSGMFFHPDFLVLLKRAGQRVGLLFTESPYDDEKQFRVASVADICWTNERTSLDYLRRSNPNTYYLPHAFNPNNHHSGNGDLDESKVPAHDVVFVGSGFQERIDLLSEVDWDGIDFGLYGPWVLLGSRNKLRRHLRGKEIDNTATAALYRKAKIGLNLHRTSRGFGRKTKKINHAESLNPRAYELAACGLFHVSDKRTEVEEIFGALVPTFTNGKELGDLLRKWIADEEGRKRIEGELSKAVAGHTWQARADQVLEDLERVNHKQSMSTEV